MRVAARFLDTGVKAYKAGRYAEAATALAESAKADPSNPLAWYFLGAAKWETVGAEVARKEFEQGAEQERLSPIPARVIGNSLSPIQGAARDALTARAAVNRPTRQRQTPAHGRRLFRRRRPVRSVVAITLVSPPAFQSYSRTTSQVSVDQRRIALVPSTVARS